MRRTATSVRPLTLCHAMIDTECFADRVRAAAGAGISSIALDRTRDQRFLDRGETHASMLAVLDDYGVRVDEIWSLYGLLHADTLTETMAALDKLLALAGTFGATMIGAPTGYDGDVARAAESLGVCCDRAAAHGVRIGVEFVAFRNLNDLATTTDIVLTADRPNAGIIVDAWHFFRGGRPDIGLIGDVPGRLFEAVQLNDGFEQARHDDPREEVRLARPLPGDGEFDVAALAAAVANVAPGVRWCVEASTDELLALEPDRAAQFVARKCRGFLDEVV